MLPSRSQKIGSNRCRAGTIGRVIFFDPPFLGIALHYLINFILHPHRSLHRDRCDRRKSMSAFLLVGLLTTTMI